MNSESTAEPQPLLGKTAIITGGSSGIGFAIAKRLTKSGAEVTICGRHSNALATAQNALGANSRAVVADITNPADVTNLIDDVVAHHGGIDFLINNAGTNVITKSADLELDQWRTILDTNLTAAFLCSQAAYPHLSYSPHAAIVNIASLTSIAPFPGRLAYGVSKAGLVMMTKILAGEWAPHVRVNAVAPGYVETDLIARQAQEGAINLDAIRRRIPMGRLAMPAEIADAVQYLLSDQSRYITGAVLLADGGYLSNLAPTL